MNGILLVNGEKIGIVSSFEFIPESNAESSTIYDIDSYKLSIEDKNVAG